MLLRMKVLILCLMGLTTALAQNSRLETNVSAVRLTFHKQDPQGQGFQVIVGNVSNHTLTELKLRLTAASFKKMDAYIQKQFMNEWAEDPDTDRDWRGS